MKTTKVFTLTVKGGSNVNGFNWSNLKNYTVWVLIFSLLLLFGQHYGFITNLQGYNQIVQTFLGLLVMIGLLNSPSQVMRLVSRSQVSFDWSALLNYAFLAGVVAFIPMVLQYFGVVIDVTFYNQAALYVLSILAALHIITGAPTQITVLSKPQAEPIPGFGTDVKT